MVSVGSYYSGTEPSDPVRLKKGVPSERLREPGDPHRVPMHTLHSHASRGSNGVDGSPIYLAAVAPIMTIPPPDTLTSTTAATEAQVAAAAAVPRTSPRPTSDNNNSASSGSRNRSTKSRSTGSESSSHHRARAASPSELSITRAVISAGTANVSLPTNRW
mmetsp:Transcript_28080/g.47186  ORF Transcript_28080/g.47186 Transcript_28080/m.47186 type:complete len:161 (-) Transcript_28080:206-688(-)